MYIILIEHLTPHQCLFDKTRIRIAIEIRLCSFTFMRALLILKKVGNMQYCINSCNKM